jgi:hypothetical protein
VAQASGRAPGIAAVVVRSTGEKAIRITTSNGGFIRGRIVDEEGRPLKGYARAEAFQGHLLPEIASSLLVADSRSDGTFAIGPMPLGAFRLHIDAQAHMAQRIDAVLGRRGQLVDLGDVALNAGVTIRGRVRDHENEGIPGATVQAVSHGPHSDEVTTESGADGEFQLKGLRRGGHQLSARATGYAAGYAQADAPAEAVGIVLDEQSGLSGRVVDESDVPVEDAEVTATEVGGIGRMAFGKSEGSLGSFLLLGLASGRYRLHVHSNGRGEATRDVVLSSGRTRDVGTIVLARGGTIEGVVVDSDGNGVPAVTVTATRAGNGGGGTHETQTTLNGAFEIGGIPRGIVQLSARHPAYAVAQAVQVDHDPTAKPTTVRLMLERGARIEGRVLYRDGRPFTAGQVHVSPLTGPRLGTREASSAPVGMNGEFAVDQVPAGRILLSIMASAPVSPLVSAARVNILVRAAARELDVSEGRTTAIDVSLRDVVVEGRVTSQGRAVPDVLIGVIGKHGGYTRTWVGPPVVHAVGSSGPSPLNGVTREDGSFALTVFEPGPAYLQVTRKGHHYPGRLLEIPDLPRFSIDFEIGAARIGGIVVFADSDEPASGAKLSVRPVSTRAGHFVATSEAGLDGRFAIEVEPGEYVLESWGPSARMVSTPVSVGPEGLADVRVELKRDR